MNVSYSIKKFLSKFINNGPFDMTSDYYVFDPRNPKKTRFIPIRKVKGNQPSNIYLRYVAFETQDPNIRDVRMALMDKCHHILELDGKPIECEGIIPKYEGWTWNDYEENVNFMLEKAAEVHKKQVEAKTEHLAFVGDLTA